jgi:hypothetical protein
MYNFCGHAGNSRQMMYGPAHFMSQHTFPNRDHQSATTQSANR